MPARARERREKGVNFINKMSRANVDIARSRRGFFRKQILRRPLTANDKLGNSIKTAEFNCFPDSLLQRGSIDAPINTQCPSPRDVEIGRRKFDRDFSSNENLQGRVSRADRARRAIEISTLNIQHSNIER